MALYTESELTQTLMQVRPTRVAAGFQPSHLSNLVLWLKADSITGLVDGDPVTTWTDSTANAYAFTQSTAAKKPTYKTSIINGWPTVRFDGTDDLLSLGSSPLGGTSGAIYAVVRPTSVTGSRIPLASGYTLGSTYWMVPVRVDDGTSYVGLTQSNNDVYDDGRATTTALSINTPYLWTCYTDGATWALEVNGIAQTLAFDFGGNNGDWWGDVTLLNTLAVGAFIGNGSAESDQFAGDIAEIIVYSSLPSAGERAQIDSYVATRYGITVA